MKTIEIEWRHLDKKGTTCNRCSLTTKNLKSAIRDLTGKCKNVIFRFREVKLPSNKISQSNQILLNGKPLEQILPEAKLSKNFCGSCAKIIGSFVQCRTLAWKGKSKDAIPVKWIKEALCIASECCS
jgi:hypothetical protein